jgi:hypothetical protein
VIAAFGFAPAPVHQDKMYATIIQHSNKFSFTFSMAVFIK